MPRLLRVLPLPPLPKLFLLLVSNTTTTTSACAATAVTYVWLLQSIMFSIFKSVFTNEIGIAIRASPLQSEYK